MSINPELAFKEIVENIFNRWTALKMAVEHGLGGRNGHETAIEIMNYITEFCIKNNNLTQGDIEDCLEEIMDQEFETICEDGSIREMSCLLLKYLKMCQENKFNEINIELNQLPPLTKWLHPGGKIIYKTIEDSDDENDDDSDDEMEIKQTTRVNQEPTEEIDPEWTTIKSRRKRN